eukprot:scaffold17148_cov31-Tisochrysis_lutea.AAC.3
MGIPVVRCTLPEAKAQCSGWCSRGVSRENGGRLTAVAGAKAQCSRWYEKGVSHRGWRQGKCECRRTRALAACQVCAHPRGAMNPPHPTRTHTNVQHRLRHSSNPVSGREHAGACGVRAYLLRKIRSSTTQMKRALRYPQQRTLGSTSCVMTSSVRVTCGCRGWLWAKARAEHVAQPLCRAMDVRAPSFGAPPAREARRPQQY